METILVLLHPDAEGAIAKAGFEAIEAARGLGGEVVIGLVGWSLNALARIFERRMQRLYGIAPR